MLSISCSRVIASWAVDKTFSDKPKEIKTLTIFLLQSADVSMELIEVIPWADLKESNVWIRVRQAVDDRCSSQTPAIFRVENGDRSGHS